MPKFILAFAAANGFLAVALGAFGAHALKAKLSSEMLSVWQTAVQYHFYHALALLAVVILARNSTQTMHQYSAYAFVIGVLLFCGSLYALALGGPRWLGPITPLGGLAFLVGWALLFVASLK